MLTAAQVRGARAILQWSVLDLVEKSGVNKNSIVRLERGGDSRYTTVLGIERALKEAGVVFREDGSVWHENCLVQPVKLKQAA